MGPREALWVEGAVGGWACHREAPDSSAALRPEASFLRSLTPSHKSVPITALKESLTELAQPQKVATVASVVLGHTVPLSSGRLGAPDSRPEP